MISALIETDSAGKMVTAYNLSVINTDTRPAIDVRLAIDNLEEFKKCITKNTKDPLLD